MFRLAYNTNGLAHHRPADAIRLLSELGYEGVSITPDVGGLDPYDLRTEVVDDVRHWAQELGMELSVETGARYLLDARHKHFPTLLESEATDRARRVDFLQRCIDLAENLGASVLSLWAGRAPDGAVADAHDPDPKKRDNIERHWDNLVSGLTQVVSHGREAGVSIAFEPEPGMFLERPSGYGELVDRMGDEGQYLGLCLDVGHLYCTGDLPPEDVIRRFGNRLLQVHLDDIKNGVHEHRMFGEGDVDLEATFNALFEVGYEGMTAVELSRDSHRGPEAAALALEHLQVALRSLGRAEGKI